MRGARRNPASIPAIALGLVLAGLLPGCSAYLAFTMPGPAGDEHVEPGMTRTQVEAALRTGPDSQYDSDGLTEAR